MIDSTPRELADWIYELLDEYPDQDLTVNDLCNDAFGIAECLLEAIGLDPESTKRSCQISRSDWEYALARLEAE